MTADRYSLAFRLYPYERHGDQDAKSPARHPVVIVGAGPVGLALALDLGRQGIPVVVLDDHEGVGEGSRAICFAKRTLEVAQRYGAAEAMVAKGVRWNLGKVFFDDRQIFDFNLLEESGHRFPAFINLPQPYFEKFLHDQISARPNNGARIDVRGRNRVVDLQQDKDGVTLKIDTPDGPYTLKSDWVIACDGASSPIRKMLNLDFEGRVFEDNFLIADIRMSDRSFPTERWFWFEPHFKAGASTLLHKQPDDIWRVDFQIGWDIDRAAELDEDKVRARLDAMLGPNANYEIVWKSIYTFQCRRMKSFRAGRILFAGDAAHQVSPFGARGANSGIQDADNLGWKLGRVIRRHSPSSLLESYQAERAAAADENILNSTRSTDFITPKSKISRIFRNAVLELAEAHTFARPMVNSGRLSLPSVYVSALNTEDALPNAPTVSRPGAPCPDAPVADGYLLDHLGDEFILLAINTPTPDVPDLTVVNLQSDLSDELAERYLGPEGCAVYLIRPDQHIAGRWSGFDKTAVQAAFNRACGKDVHG